MIDFKQHFRSFFALIAEGQIEIYNEFSLQHELGIYLRSVLGTDLKIQFERSISFFGLPKSDFEKKEMDIAVFTSDQSVKYAIELKCPRSGQHPEQMFKACQDIRFLEQLAYSGFTKGFFVMVVDDPLFYERGTKIGIYQYFRSQTPLSGVIQKPTGKRDRSFELEGCYSISWKHIRESMKYAVVEIAGPQTPKL